MIYHTKQSTQSVISKLNLQISTHRKLYFKRENEERDLWGSFQNQTDLRPV